MEGQGAPLVRTQEGKFLVVEENFVFQLATAVKHILATTILCAYIYTIYIRANFIKETEFLTRYLFNI